LCAFLPTLKDRQTVMHELNTIIHDRFRESGINIPYPQREITLTVNSDAAPLEEAMRRVGIPA